MNISNSHKILFADQLRGIASLLVLMSHYFCVFWVRPKDVASFIHAKVYIGEKFIFTLPSILQGGFNLGSFGVAIFFLISGFVIPFSIYKYSRIQFTINRLLRIYPLYWTALTISIIAVIFSSKFFHQPVDLGIKRILANYTLTNYIVNQQTIDGVNWTLQIEICFYLLCAFLLKQFREYKLKVIFSIPLCLGVLILILSFFVRISIMYFI